MAQDEQAAPSEGGDDPKAALAAARAQYREVFGKQPFQGWGLDEIQRRLGEVANTGNTEQAAPSEGPPPVRVLLLGDHVFLPVDPTSPTWREDETRQYDGKADGRRARVSCHPGLAAFLQERGQAETLDD